LKLQLELTPEMTAKALLNGIIVKYPTEYNPGHLGRCKEEFYIGSDHSWTKKLDLE
jgi:hypothetical protein